MFKLIHSRELVNKDDIKLGPCENLVTNVWAEPEKNSEGGY
jgi:hypothetical protein